MCLAIAEFRRQAARIPVLRHSEFPPRARVPRDYRRALSFANALAAALAKVLGDIVALVILHGSLALGDFEPEQSLARAIKVGAATLRISTSRRGKEQVDRIHRRAPGW